MQITDESLADWFYYARLTMGGGQHVTLERSVWHLDSASELNKKRTEQKVKCTKSEVN